MWISHTYTYTPSLLSRPPTYPPPHPSRPSRGTELSPLCCTVASLAAIHDSVCHGSRPLSPVCPTLPFHPASTWPPSVSISPPTPTIGSSVPFPQIVSVCSYMMHLFFWLPPVWQTLGSSASLQMTQFRPLNSSRVSEYSNHGARIISEAQESHPAYRSL